MMNSDLVTSLETVHDLALYESGNALLGEKEKAALFATKQFARLLKGIDEKKLIELIK